MATKPERTAPPETQLAESPLFGGNAQGELFS